jgi:hypothetical protein
MPVAVSVRQFTRRLVDSGLMSADAVAAVIDALPGGKGNSLVPGPPKARFLGMSPWQRTFLFTG